MKDINCCEYESVFGGVAPRVVVDPITGEITIKTCVDIF